jgi:hypothetical protein
MVDEDSRVIRDLSDDNHHVWVVYEIGRGRRPSGPGDWSIVQYPLACWPIRNKVRDYFSMNITLPGREGGAERELAKHLIENGTRVEQATPDEVERFVDGFVEGVFIKAHPEGMSFEEYLEKMKDSDIEHIPDDVLLRTRRIMEEISESPGLVGLPKGGNFYREVRLCNPLSRRIERNVKVYCETGIEPEITQRSALTQVDLFYVSQYGRGYAIELKTRKKAKTNNIHKKQSKKQVRLATHFFMRNFGVDCVAVNVEGQGVRSKKIRFRHRVFDPETRKFNICVDRWGWENY